MDSKDILRGEVKQRNDLKVIKMIDFVFQHMEPIWSSQSTGNDDDDDVLLDCDAIKVSNDNFFTLFISMVAVQWYQPSMYEVF